MITPIDISMPVVYMVRAEGGKYAHAFRKGGYAAIGWFEDQDLRLSIETADKEHFRSQYQKYYPDDSNVRAGQNLGQIWRFLAEVSTGTYIVTPTDDTGKLMVGQVVGEYYFAPNLIDSPFPHRKPVKWFDELLSRSALSVPTQNTLRSTLTVFRIPQYDEILGPYKVPLPVEQTKVTVTDEAVGKLILSRLLDLSADEFEILVTELLTAVGFEASHVGKIGDEGIDVTGTLRVYDFASIDLRVQVKRYASSKINHNAIKHFRSSVPEKSQAAFVTTSDFDNKAREEAEKPGFKKIGLINGKQLVGILAEHYEDLSPELKQKLNLHRTLIPL